MIRRIRIAAISILLSFCLAGCFSADSLEDTTITDTTESSVPPSDTQSQTTERHDNETTLPETTAPPEPNDEDFVRIEDYIPDIVIDLRYSTENNFTNQQIYDFTDAWLRFGTVKKLMLVQDDLKESGYRLKIWDAFRPPSAQFKLWDVCPDPTYVSNPNNGFSSHSRGNTVDITLVFADGTELVMPTGFDDFSQKSDRDYSDCGKKAADNALFLEELMIKYGFKPYFGEWWHFTDTQAYPVDQSFEPATASES